MADHLVRGIIEDRGLRFAAASTTDLCRHAAGLHGCLSTAAVALCRGLTSGLLAAAETLAAETRIKLHFVGKGPLGSVMVDADAEGNVRGYVRNPSVNLKVGRPSPVSSEETLRGMVMRLSIASAVGAGGQLYVIREGGSGEVYQGISGLVSGEVDRDVVHYLQQSEQIESAAMAADALLAQDGEVSLAAGVLLTTLPGGDAGFARALDERLAEGGLVPVMAAAARDGQVGARALLAALLPDEKLTVLDDRLAHFRCRCSAGRADAAILSMGVAEIDALVQTGETVQVSCDFCTTDYSFTPERLLALLETARKSDEAHAV